MVQRKVPKPHLLKSDTQLVDLRPSSPQTHEKLKKIMKKSKPIKRSNELKSLPPFKKKGAQPLDEDGSRSTSETTPKKQSPNYMKSTSSFEARKTPSPTPKAKEKSKTDSLASGHKGSRTSSLKVVKTLTKTPSFKPSKKCSSVMLCGDLDAQRATCSSTLKDSKFPDYLELSHGGTELDGTSAMKVCPYTYCSLNGHHRPPVPPLRCFLSARRHALKTQKSCKLGCLSPRHVKSIEKKNEEIVRGPVIFEAPEVYMEAETPMAPLVEEESRDFECSDIDWEGCCKKSQDIDGDVCEEQIWKTGVESLFGEIQDSYDEESVSSGAWGSEEDCDSESCSSFEGLSTTTETDVNEKMDEDKIRSITEEIEATNGCENAGFEEKKDELDGRNHPFGEETSQGSETVPDFAENSQDGTSKLHTTIIYNIIQFNISVFINGEKTEHSEMDKGVTVQVAATATNEMETDEVNEEQGMSNEDDDANNFTSFDEISKADQMVSGEEIPFDSKDSVSDEQLRCNEPEKKHNECFEDDKHSEIDEEPVSKSEEKQTDSTGEITSKPDTPNSSINLGWSTRGKILDQETEDSNEFNPRGPNFLPEVADPDAETVDLRHQMMDERKNAEEWMVDFALQQAVTTLAPARKRKVALLVEAFEKVMPVPKYETHNRRTSKAFVNARPMQACI